MSAGNPRHDDANKYSEVVCSLATLLAYFRSIMFQLNELMNELQNLWNHGRVHMIFVHFNSYVIYVGYFNRSHDWNSIILQQGMGISSLISSTAIQSNTIFQHRGAMLAS